MLRTINLEAGFPTLDDARRDAITALRQARRDGVRVLKVIHGYGSSGMGGKLCVGLRKSFRLRQAEGAIRDFVPGECFSIFNPTVLAMIETCPAVRGDPDLEAVNEGITLLWLK
jgi:hypothetical protein